MTVAAVPSIKSYVYAGPIAYSFNFRIFTEDDIKLTYVKVSDNTKTVLVLNTDYTVAVNADQRVNPGGVCTVSYDVTVDGGPLHIQRITPLTQPTDWVNNNPFSAELLENDLDRLMMALQDLYYNEHVYFDALDDFKYIGAWTASYAYDKLNIVTNANTYYVAHTAFTSGAVFSAANWNILLELSDVVASAAAAAESEINAANCAAEAVSVLSTSVAKTASTGAAILPVGTTAQRPGTPVIGHLRFNTTLGYLEVYNGSAWVAV